MPQPTLMNVRLDDELSTNAYNECDQYSLCTGAHDMTVFIRTRLRERQCCLSRSSPWILGLLLIAGVLTLSACVKREIKEDPWREPPAKERSVESQTF